MASVRSSRRPTASETRNPLPSAGQLLGLSRGIHLDRSTVGRIRWHHSRGFTFIVDLNLVGQPLIDVDARDGDWDEEGSIRVRGVSPCVVHVAIQ